MEAFANALEGLIAKYGQTLSDNEIITTLEEALSRAWGFACEPQPASLFAEAPEMLKALKQCRTSIAGYHIRYRDDAVQTVAEFFNELQRIDKVAKDAISAATGGAK